MKCCIIKTLSQEKLHDSDNTVSDEPSAYHRDTLVRLGEVVCRTPEEFKAWSQNLGHEQVLTTFSSYGEVPQNRQSEVFERLRKPVEQTDQSDVEALARAVLAQRG